MSGKRPFFLIVLIAGAILLCCNIFVQSRLDESIKRNKLIDEQFVEGAPPLVSFTTMALGGFRGIIADFLWFRAIGLQDQGKNFEMVQLASWIMKLQPKSTASAAYLGWNMAYNISVTQRLPQDRWRWVNKGIELYHEALQYNPNDPILYKELGWIYQHKLGNILDDAQRYYKLQMASTMYHILGAHYPDWKKLAAAPAKEKDLVKKIKNYPEFIQKLQSAGYAKIGDLETIFRANNGVMPDKVTKVFEQMPQDLALMTDYFRVKWLYDRFMLEPEIIVRVNQKYGELDWFLPESFAIYWTTIGIERSPKRQNVDCTRMITQAMQVIFTNGRMLYPGKEPSIDFMLIPNLSVVDTVRDVYLKAVEENPDIMSFVHAYRNFMTRAMLTLFSYGHYDKAREYYDYLRKTDKGHNVMRFSFEQYIYDSWAEEMKSVGYKQAQDLINGMIVKACILLAYGDTTAAESHLRMAEICYTKYSEDQNMDRVKLVPFAQMKSQIAQAMIKSLPPELAERLKGFAALEAQEKAETDKKTSEPVK